MAKKIDPEQELVCRLVAELKKERLRQGLSMYRLAKMSTISDRAIAKIEAGNQNPTLYTIFKLSSALETNVGKLIQNIEKGQS